jgi:hypothetical protein
MCMCFLHTFQTHFKMSKFLKNIFTCISPHTMWSQYRFTKNWLYVARVKQKFGAKIRCFTICMFYVGETQLHLTKIDEWVENIPLRNFVKHPYGLGGPRLPNRLTMFGVVQVGRRNERQSATISREQPIRRGDDNVIKRQQLCSSMMLRNGPEEWDGRLSWLGMAFGDNSEFGGAPSRVHGAVHGEAPHASLGVADPYLFWKCENRHVKDTIWSTYKVHSDWSPRMPSQKKKWCWPSSWKLFGLEPIIWHAYTGL